MKNLTIIFILLCSVAVAQNCKEIKKTSSTTNSTGFNYETPPAKIGFTKTIDTADRNNDSYTIKLVFPEGKPEPELKGLVSIFFENGTIFDYDNKNPLNMVMIFNRKKEQGGGLFAAFTIPKDHLKTFETRKIIKVRILTQDFKISDSDQNKNLKYLNCLSGL